MRPDNPRQLAFKVLQRVQKGAFADIALERVFQVSELTQRDRRFITELVYGSVRQQRTLDALINQLSTQKKRTYPVNLRLILRLGLYQICYLSHVPASAAVNTTVELAKINGLKGLSGLVNGMLRQYLRMQDVSERTDIASLLSLPDNSITRLGLLHSYPDWIVALWIKQVGVEQTAKLCQWFNQPPSIDLRVNQRQVSTQAVKSAFAAVGITTQSLSGLPNTLRLGERPGAIQSLPGFNEGWWTIQDASAQLVGYLLDPQPGELIIDVCAAPGGKTTHIAELMGDMGQVWACDRNASRLRKVAENSQRLRLMSITTHVKDCTLSDPDITSKSNGLQERSPWAAIADRVLVDAPCSGLGTLHRHADARWRQTSHDGMKLSNLQSKLLHKTSQWVKPGGYLVYSTCTLNPTENESVIQAFLKHHPEWRIESPINNPTLESFTQPQGWLTLWPHLAKMDGFFMTRLKRD